MLLPPSQFGASLRMLSDVALDGRRDCESSNAIGSPIRRRGISISLLGGQRLVYSLRGTRDELACVDSRPRVVAHEHRAKARSRLE